MIPEVRLDAETGRVAIKTAMMSPRTWFIFDVRGGGHYAPGDRAPDDVADWLPYTEPSLPPEAGEGV